MKGRVVVRCSKRVIPVMLLSFHILSYGIAAYIPQALKDCISIAYKVSEPHRRKQGLEELYSAIRENRILISDKVVYKAIKEALEVVKSPSDKINNRSQQEMINYLDQYLNNANDKTILLFMQGSSYQTATWSAGEIQQAMAEQKEAYNVLLLSNQLSDNLILSGVPSIDFAELDKGLLSDLFGQNQSNSGIVFTPGDMTNSQSSMPSFIIGSTGVGSSIINGWLLPASAQLQYPINIQFEAPSDLQAKDKATLEIGLLVPNNGFDDGYARFQVQSKYVASNYSFDPMNIPWSHTNVSSNVKIQESLKAGDVRYIRVEIPLSQVKVKQGQLVLLNISRVLPKNFADEYVGELAIVSAKFNYTSNGSGFSW